MPISSVSRPRPSRLVRILRAPAIRFTVAGALLFAATHGSSPNRGSAVAAGAREIVVDAARIRGIKRDYAITNPGKASQGDIQALVDRLVNDEILFREGIARGFEEEDRSIKWRLVQKMRYLGEDHGESDDELGRRAVAMGLHLSDPVVRSVIVEKMRLVVGRAAPAPTEAELAAWYATHQGNYAQAGRATLRHVFFDRGRRGQDGAKQAAEAAGLAAAGRGVDAAPSLGGDPFVMGYELPAQGRDDLTKFFGPKFADDVLAMPEGSWRGPVESAYGWHLVFVEKRLEARVPDLAEVHSSVEKSYENEKRAERVTAFLDRMRPSYTIRIDDSEIAGGARG